MSSSQTPMLEDRGLSTGRGIGDFRMVDWRTFQPCNGDATGLQRSTLPEIRGRIGGGCRLAMTTTLFWTPWTSPRVRRPAIFRMPASALASGGPCHAESYLFFRFPGDTLECAAGLSVSEASCQNLLVMGQFWTGHPHKSPEKDGYGGPRGQAFNGRKDGRKRLI